ncbi:hypothetical protein SGFS_047950 [Streptomyces graminofaciens]|uniref:Class E sortase n=1 Tax=Streptomyces graminofaciens TaxID=68212 RepID=A0ABN5VKC9_9ACTN|nr:hypothetical protein SGFS_047950 [Streptomyces graminofaciens]
MEALEKEWANTPDAPDPATALPAPGAADTDGDPGGGPDPRRPLAAPDRSTSPHSPQAYAVLTIPRLHLRVPVAEGVGRTDVLDKGYVGHYPRTAQPGRPGNFALAGHRNTHGEPFRYLNRLRHGDEVRVETRTAVYTYVVDRTLPQTSPGDGGVLRAVPRSAARPSYGYDEPGHYLTLTTCTPEYTSTYRLVVWGKLRSVRLR